MLNLWRRHLESCKHGTRKHKNCSCPIWVQGSLHGKWIKKSLGVRNWESAQRIVREWEARPGSGLVSVTEALTRFIADCRARGLKPETLGKYLLLEREIKKRFGVRPVDALTLDDLAEYRETWDLAPISSKKKIERLRTFFRFCLERGWIERNPAVLLKAPQPKFSPTLPFTGEEMKRILSACERYPDKPRGRRLEVRAFVLLLRYAGLRIRDAVTLKSDRLRDGRIFLYTQKTGVPVYLPLPGDVLKSLEHINPSDGYFFWSGNGAEKSAVADWQRSLYRLFRLAGVQGGHAHRFRDTFAVELLSKGVALEQVSILLGHTSIKTTEKHYAPWVHARQAALEKAVMKTWASVSPKERRRPGNVLRFRKEAAPSPR